MRNILQKLYHRDLKKVYKKFTTNGGKYVFDNVIGDIPDLQTYFEKFHKQIRKSDRILISFHNPVWEPVLELASILGMRKKTGIQNWLDTDDISNILNLSGFEVLTTQKRFFGISTITIARPKPFFNPQRKYSVSIIIPARNEEGNIKKIIPSIPRFGKSQEYIFVEGNSKDKTWDAICGVEKKYKKIKILKQTGKGKADAVWLGLKKAKGDILMIYDADRTVDAKDLSKFYNALSGSLGDFANGNRLLYPMEKDAMQNLNKIGNYIFSQLFTCILGQRFKDTLCGTKAFFRKDYLKFKHSKNDPFGDFDLIFGAIRNNLKVVEIPVRYKERVYGSTNINRFYHGLLLVKMVAAAFREFKL
jgi:hypothetical protein